MHFDGRALGRSLGLFALGLFFVPRSADAEAPDPALRGLALFVHGPSSAFGGAEATLDVSAYGFPEVARARPLAGATITAAFDPETLGAGALQAPAPVTAESDANGHARIVVPVPEGPTGELELLVAVRHGTHVSTRSVKVARRSGRAVELRVPDRHLVPGSRAPVWLSVTDPRREAPVPNAAVDVTLLEGKVARAKTRVVTDATGFARTSLPVPTELSALAGLELEARLSDGADHAKVAVGLREERPATPRLHVALRELELRPGERGHADVTVLDAAGEPLSGQPLVYWIGPKGTTRPSADADWKKAGQAARTDGLGHVELAVPAPALVTARGSEVTVVVRTELEGQKLEEATTIGVGQAAATATLAVEGGALVPGLAQRAYLHLDDGARPVAGSFVVEGDGLAATVTTDALGDAELTWKVPAEIGAQRAQGPCAGGVAAAVRVRAATPLAALARHPEPFEICVPVDRERATLLRTSAAVARTGTKVKITRARSPRSAAANAAGSLALVGAEGAGTSRWLADGEDLDLAGVAPGPYALTLATPRADGPAETTTTSLLVLPAVLPKVAGAVAGGRIAPGGEIEIEASLDDGHGRPVAGTVSALVIDKEGGGSLEGILAMDRRLGLCAAAGAPDRADCDAFLEGDRELVRRRALTAASTAPAALAPTADPAAYAASDLSRTFAAVLRSLEGAVFQASTPEALRDVRRREGGAWRFNPELMTLVTAAMPEAPTTPGGEPFGLRDLVATDPQVTFDVVARRVTRLKLFQVLKTLREHKQTEEISADEPYLRDPPALLRRLVRSGSLPAERLLDPWGGTLQFVRTPGPTVPFLNLVNGWTLVSPGPDGVLGTPDDVRDPFERVVRSKSPYAEALGEDEIVDAKWDMRVGDATVQAWTEMFARLTGTALGESAVGSGFGNGHGGLGGAGHGRAATVRYGRGITFDTAQWTDPVRVDANGKVRLKVKLGDHETTWRIALVARTDAADTAVSTLDVPTFLPVSARVVLGSQLTAGDQVGARVVVRNRTSAPRAVTVDLAAAGELALAKGQPRTLALEVPAQSVRSVVAGVVAHGEGVGRLTATLAAGADHDVTTQEIGVAPAGEPSVVMASWMTAPGRVAKRKLRVELAPGYVPHGPGQLVVTSGLGDPLRGAIAALAPDATTPYAKLADAVEIGAAISAYGRAANDPALVTEARELAERARTYLESRADTASRAYTYAAMRAVARAEDKGTLTAPQCPPNRPESAAETIAYLEAEPAPTERGPLPCFSSAVSVLEAKTPLDQARAIHALVDRPHRSAVVAGLARDLAQATHADGLAPRVDGARAEQAILLTALARTASVWSSRGEAARVLVDRALTLRDATGGYGSAEATRDVVRALVTLERTPPQATRVSVTTGKTKRTLEIAANAAGVLALPPDAREAEVETSGGPVLVRFVRPALRTYRAPLETPVAPVAVTAEWPPQAFVGTTGLLQLAYKRGLGPPLTVATRVPLPPGVELAAAEPDVAIRQGALEIVTTPGTTRILSIPVRFTLSGRFSIPPTSTVGRSDEQPRVTTPAGILEVR